METVVQTPPSYSRGGTGPRNPQPGSSGLSSQHRRGQTASAMSAGYNRGRGGPAEEASSDQNSQPTNSNSNAGSDGKRRDSNNKLSSQSPVKKNRRRRNRNNHHNAYGRFAGGSAWRGGPGRPPGTDGWTRPGASGGQGVVGVHHGVTGGGRAGRGFRPAGTNQAAKLAPSATASQQKDTTTAGNNNKATNWSTPNLGNANTSGSSKNSSGAKHGGSNNQRFRYGNYNRYYGYRNGADGDSRLPLLKRKWFENKVCLDIGCNVGHVTLSVARDHAPRQIIGMDIDPALIRIARKNVRHYVHEENVQGRWFPDSCAITFGPIAMAPVGGAEAGPYSNRTSTRHQSAGASNRDGASTSSSQVGPAPFPYNIFFTRGNYVLDDDDLLDTQHEEFDTIMCLSTSKWIQLNFGDEGLKRTFKRVYRQLRPGGRFVFEPQPLSSYHKFCTPEHRENFRKMQLKPDEFPDYLTREVGFASCKILGVGNHGAKNFQRPLFLLRKAADDGRDDSGDGQINTPNSSSGAREKSAGKEFDVRDGEDKGPSTSTSNAAETSGQASQPRSSPAHECDTTTASI
ncbi:7SK snRNA methylphosphate capping enzyme-like [Tropilaelaps mercedesae]|uniref:RNA methyltransferase n=1 Tax=Tropilaelaps mercedesae TaxID=418985 RepID=A0A1V9XHP5_9ACAR|nr:7SK snRNA methylphosphate capping enzyme-like [Tropilaelaps mercedesae]